MKRTPADRRRARQARRRTEPRLDPDDAALLMELTEALIDFYALMPTPEQLRAASSPPGAKMPS